MEELQAQVTELNEVVVQQRTAISQLMQQLNLGPPEPKTPLLFHHLLQNLRKFWN